MKKDEWYKKNAPEFYIENFKDVTEGGKKEQCAVCKQWDYYKNLTSEWGTLYYHPKCKQEWCYL